MKKKAQKPKNVNQSALEAKRYYRKTLKTLDNECKALLQKFAKKYPSIKQRMILNYCEKQNWVEKYISIDLKHLWNIKEDIIGDKPVSHSSDESEQEEEEVDFSPPQNRKQDPKPRRYNEQNRRKKQHQHWPTGRQHYHSKHAQSGHYQTREHRRDKFEPKKYRERGNRRRQRHEPRRNGQRTQRVANGQRKGEYWKRKRDEEPRNTGNVVGKEPEKEEKRSGKKKAEERDPRVENGSEKSKREEAEEPVDFGNEFMKKENMESPKSIQSIEDFRKKEEDRQNPIQSVFAKENQNEEEGTEKPLENGKEGEKQSREDMNDSFGLIIAKKTETGAGMDQSTLSNQVRTKPNPAQTGEKMKQLVLKMVEKWVTIKRIVMDKLRDFLRGHKQIQYEFMPEVGHGYYNGKGRELGAIKKDMELPNGVDQKMLDIFFENSMTSNINHETVFAKGFKNMTSNFTINTGMIPNSRRKVEKIDDAQMKIIGSSPEIFEKSPKLLEKISRMKAQKISERVLQKPQTEAYQNQAKINSLSLNMGNNKTQIKRAQNPRMVNLVNGRI